MVLAAVLVRNVYFQVIEHPDFYCFTAGRMYYLLVCAGLVSYFIATSHDTVIPDFASGGVFPRTPTVIADCGIIVTYVAMIAAVVVALYSEVAKLFK